MKQQYKQHLQDEEKGDSGTLTSQETPPTPTTTSKEPSFASSQNNPTYQELRPIYEKALDTLEVLISKLGLKGQFERVLEAYDREFESGRSSLHLTLIKVLTRCKILYVSLYKI
jgi:hypothetical protein